jgi:hypothetical protein
VPTEENVTVDVRKLEASVTLLQKKYTTATTALEADARRQGELGAARLNALEAQLARVFPPEPITGKGSRKTKAKGVSDVLLEIRVSELEKAVACMAEAVKTATKEITNKLQKQKQPEASVAGGSAGHVQDVSLQKDVTSNTSRIAVIEGQNTIAVGNLAMFNSQLVDLQQKVSTIEVSMKQAAPESKSVVQPTAPNRQGITRVSARAQTIDNEATYRSGSRAKSPSSPPCQRSPRQRSPRQRSPRQRSPRQSSPRERSPDSPPRQTTPYKRYVVCMMCL